MTARRVGPYGKLLANYASDDAIIAAGEAAELLFCRGVAFLSTSDSDGFITDGQLVRVVGAGMRDAARRAEALVENGLWIREEGGYQVRSYLKINESAEEKGRARSTDRERKRRERETESERSPNGHAPDSERNPIGVTPDSLTALTLGRELDSPVKGSQGQGRNPDGTPEPPPQFCEKHPNGTDAPCGACGSARRRYDALTATRSGELEAARRAIAEARKTCPDCGGSGWIETTDGLPAGKCNHQHARAL